MSNEQNFLITYGLHNFVTHALTKGKHVFSIGGVESHKMISHAKNLITESFGETADIQVV
jgi:hypothetical protein